MFFAEKETESQVRQQIIKILYIIGMCAQDLNIVDYLTYDPYQTLPPSKPQKYHDPTIDLE